MAVDRRDVLAMMAVTAAGASAPADAAAGEARQGSRQRARAYGLRFGVLPAGPLNAITDVAGVKVGHVTVKQGPACTGVTAILPHDGNIFQQKVPGAIYLGNAFGKLAGYTQVKELGAIETPVVLTNTLSVGDAVKAVVRHTLGLPGNAAVKSVNALVGETNDGGLNDIRGFHVTEAHVLQAIRDARAGPVPEGAVGAGTGTETFGVKGGIGTASRRLPAELGGYTLGVLVQTNFGGVMTLDGASVGRDLGTYPYRDMLEREAPAGSCMVVVATDAPVDARNLERLAKRAFTGLVRAGSSVTNGSGEYVIAFSTDPALRVPHESADALHAVRLLRDDRMSPLFMAAIEAAEEAVANALFMAATTSANGVTVPALDPEKVMAILRRPFPAGS